MFNSDGLNYAMHRIIPADIPFKEDKRRKISWGYPYYEDTQSIEERELREKLARLNAQVAQANAELAEALRLSAETEHTAVEAQLAAERAKEEAKNIQEEIAFREKVEERRREHEKKKQEEERRKMEEQRLREEEIIREKEEEWRRREHGAEKTVEWDTWPTYEYKVDDDRFDVGCIIRADPNKFNRNDVTCTVLDQMESPVPFSESEELVSLILHLEYRNAEEKLKDKVIVCVPYSSSKQSHGHNSKEAVVKIEKDGHWVCLETKEEVLDGYKDTKFAAAETRSLGRMAVFSRLKRDYATLSKKGGKVTSSYDQRISLTVPKDCIHGKDHILMEVQPIDSSSVNDLKNRSKTCKGLLNSSPIIHMEFESAEFKKPVTVTVPCPPNPIKAKKIAAMRKAKEDKMNNPPKVHILLPHEIEAMEKEKQKSKLQRMQEQLAADENKVDEPKPTKWYMGDYANNEDDENDNLYLISAQGNKWSPVENVNIMQVKLDLLQFELDKPLEKFMVLRTKTNVHEDTVGTMATEMSNLLSQKFVQVILKQKNDDPFDTVMSVVPQSKTDKTLKDLSKEGYDDGPEPSPVLSINEGDVIEVCFRGNVKNKDAEGIQFVYNSNLKSETEFYACEVDKYLQKNFPVYRGVVEVYRKYKVKNTTRRKRRDSSDDQDEPPFEIKKELMCELAINIPKYHVEQNTTVVRAPVTIHNTSDAVNEDMLRFLAEELGDEWKMVASHLGVSKPRVQAIIRNMQYGDQSDADARFDMLMTWLKKTPKAVDKVSCLSNALLKSSRGDLAEEVRARDRDFREHHRAR
ncbi:death domain-containing protein 1-like isoform X2 [Ruditapes philippinarum]|uniref:death domain-containing protein 1-like isoform X2 n=1 Tax=Ruditapes philippinarum TaxID=129788 RepID=UPI00295A98A3|nr:death domain-containing protein 1-like isoform X2 [Ruditapes philippinarum]